jgi:gluconolactonase
MPHPQGSRNLQATLVALALGSGFAWGQDFGTAELPADLADAGTKVLGAMNKAPNGGRNLGYSEGPVGDAEGNLYFTEDNAGGATGNIWKVSPTGQASNFYNGPGLPNGLEFDNAGKLVSAEKGAIAVYDVKVGGSSRTVLPMDPADALKASYRYNDVTIASNGGMFFTNHAFGNQILYRSPAGKVTVYTYADNQAPTSMAVKIPNGPEYIEEKKMLLVTADGPAKVYRYDVADDGTLSNKTEFASVAEPDGLTVDEKGNIYIASYNDGTIYVYGAAGGKFIGKIKVGTGSSGNASNCAFGGVDGKTLFITGNGGAYKVQMKVKGRTRPGTVGLRHGRALFAAPAQRTAAAGFSFDGRRVDARLPAALLLVKAPAR